MTKKRSKLKTTIIAFLILAGMGGIFEMLGVTEDTITDDPVGEVAVEEVEKPTKETKEDINTAVRNVIVNVIGETNNMDNNTISNLQVNNYKGTSEKIVIAKINASSNLTNNLMKTKILSDSRDIFKELLEIEEISEVVLNWDFPLVDQYGNEEVNTIISMAMDKEIANKINWKNFNSDNLQNIAIDYFEHPAINK